MHPRIIRLFKRSFPWLEHVQIQHNAPRPQLASEAVHMREMPLISHAVHGIDVPPPNPYLLPDEVRKKAVRQRNCAVSDGHPLVGLCWRSSDNRKQFSPRADFLQRNQIDFETYIAHGSRYWRKNINLSYFEDIIANPTIRTVSLQYGLAEWEVCQMAVHPI